MNRKTAEETERMSLPGSIEREPAFAHYPAIDIPELDVAGASLRVIIGDA